MNANWKRCTPGFPCPVCQNDGWCQVSEDGDTCMCMRDGSGEEHTDVNGSKFFIHKLSRATAGAGAGPAVASLATADRTDAVYNALLGQLTLEPYHRQNLLARGLTDAAIEAGVYRSLGREGRARVARALNERFGQDLFTVPGFVWREGERGSYPDLVGSNGLLIPVRNRLGKIVCMKIRRDGNVAGPKYVYLSPGEKYPGVKPVASVHVPKGTAEACERVRLTEGELKADAAWLMSGVPTISIPGVTNWRPAIAVIKELGCKTVLLAFDADAVEKRSVARALRDCFRALKEAGVKLELERWPAEFKGIDDALYGKTAIEVLEGDKAEEGLKELCKKAGLPAAGDEPKSSASKLVSLALKELELFHDSQQKAYASSLKLPRKTFALNSTEAKLWVGRLFYQKFRSVPGGEAIGSAMNQLEGLAIHDGREHEASLRVAGSDGAIFLDLGGPEWKAVAIRAEGWQITQDYPVRFRRPRSMLAIPDPIAGGTIDELREFVNIGSDLDWRLLVGFLLASLRPTGPYPVLCLHGEQGSAKSTTARVIRSLIDPNLAPLRAEPAEMRDLAISAANSWIMCFDNLSTVHLWLSNALCRLSTGGGFQTRQLCTDEEEIVFHSTRPTILTGIEDLAAKSDLLERSLILHLPSIPPEGRRTESDFWLAFQEARPRILGALMAGLCLGLRDVGSIARPVELPRLADLAMWVTACEPALGWERGAFLASYAENVEEANEQALDASTVGTAIRDFMKNLETWEGTYAELLDALSHHVGDKKASAKDWPKRTRDLSGRIRAVLPNIRKIGIQINFLRIGRQGVRGINLAKKVGKTASALSAASAPAENTVFMLTDADADQRLLTEADGDGREHRQHGQFDASALLGSGLDAVDAHAADAADNADAVFPGLSGEDEFSL